MKDIRSRLGMLSPGNGPYDDERFLPRGDRIGQGGVRGLVGQIFLTGEETQERAPLQRAMVANGAAQHRIAGLKGIEDGALRDRTIDVERHLAADVRQVAEMRGKNNADHARHFATPLLALIVLGDAPSVIPFSRQV